MNYDIEIDKMTDEKEAREERIAAYVERMQKSALKKSYIVVKKLVEERKRRGMTQQDLADITGILPSNLARFESGRRVPTLVVLEKYASAIGMHIEINVCEGSEN